MKVDINIDRSSLPLLNRHECHPNRISVAASKFIRGREIELNVIDGFIVWRRVGDDEWQELAAQDYFRVPIILNLESSEYQKIGEHVVEYLDRDLPISVAVKECENAPLRWIISFEKEENNHGYYLYTASYTISHIFLNQRRYLLSPTGLVTINQAAISDDVATKSWVTSELSKKIDAIAGKGLSTEDFTTALRQKLEQLNNYDDTVINLAIESVQNQLDTLLKGDVNGVIDSFNEIEAFLSGITDAQTLTGLLADLRKEIITTLNDKIDQTVGNINLLLERI